MSKLLASEKLSPVKECEALINRNSEYRLSGDLGEFFRCAITGKDCIGKEITDDDDQSSQFFSRAHAVINMKKIKRCPSFGMDKEMVKALIMKRKENETNELLDQI
jgi:hypothetical protein